MASFQWTDPKTGKTYKGAEGQRRWVESMKPAGPAKGISGALTPAPPPPVGTYDPAIDYNAGASQRGYDQYAGDAQTSFEHGQQDYGLGLSDLTTGRDRSLADLLTGDQRNYQDWSLATDDNKRQFGILGHQQGERAAQSGVTSAGLLGRSAEVRGENQNREQGRLDLSRDRNFENNATARGRVGEDFDRGKLGLDVGNARQFGGFNGQQIINPLTGVPEYGSLLTGVTRAGGENNAFQTASAGQRSQQAAASGYVPPVPGPHTAQDARSFLERYRARGGRKY